ncbi:MAG: 2-oxoacid:acceptor oxidoreductase subunit alpha [Deltaproteobacteria bacterium]|nr:2-oxoacid:acceptor oxidoreductase subunit alpha [Deltaproteobacteria bacterium]
MSDVVPIHKEIEEREEAVIRFCGDSGDGMQLTGSRFTDTTALLGNDLATLPDYPAEIRAPAGSLAGVSGYQIHFSSKDIRTPGDAPDVLVAMNPAALKTNINDLKEGGSLIANSDAFTEDNLKQAGYAANPLEDGSLRRFSVYQIPMTTLNNNSLASSALPKKEKERCRNFFALGLVFWLFERPMDITLQWIDNKFKGRPDLAEANKSALKGGYYFGETTEAFRKQYKITKASLTPGLYRHITGNEATALGFIAASQLAGKNLLYASYPITPASDILHELSRHKNFGVKTLQAEDEIAAAGMALGAAFSGAIGLTGTSGPGLALKSETISLAIMMELPMVIIDVQRGGPSTGLPTKTEQSDLFQAFYGRHGESPIAILAPATPGDCFTMAVEAVQWAIKYMTPVLYMSDGYLANGAEPWLIPDVEKMEKIQTNHPSDPAAFLPYKRDPATLSRPWALPGTPGLEHRIGGLEKADVTGNVSYDPDNHEKMVLLRAEKIARIAQDVPPLKIFGKGAGDILVVGWGSTYGAITSAVEQLQKEGLSISSIHLRHLNPFPTNLEALLRNFETVIVPEMNSGQLATILRARFLVDVKSISKIKGQPFKIKEIVDGIRGEKKLWPKKSISLPN